MSATNPTPRHRVRVFVDFWNYTLSMRDTDRPFRTDWSRIGPALVDEAGRCVPGPADPEYQGLNFYGSYDRSSIQDRRLRHWATTKVDRFPGVAVSIVPRQKKRSPPHCPDCRTPVPVCPSCGHTCAAPRRKASTSASPQT